MTETSPNPTLSGIYAADASQASAVNGFSATDTPLPTHQSYMGLTDVCGQQLGSNVTPGSILDSFTYPADAYALMYLANPLWVNPSPNFDPADPLYAYASWQIAQMHPVFVPNVSDFVVEFAADANGDDAIDQNSQGIIWYAHYANTATNTEIPTGAYAAAVYDSLPGSNRSGAFVWRHDDPSNWPYLIRIRYRVHDQRGELESGDQQHGKWFEHIIRTPIP